MNGTITTDRIAAAIWILLGLVTVILSANMDRLEHLRVNPLTVPGIVPGLLGLALIGFGGALALRRDAPEPDMPAEDSQSDAVSRGPVLVVGGICMIYGVGLLGRGLPFWLTTAGFVFCLCLVIETLLGDTAWPRRLAVAVACAIVTTAFVIFVFQDLLLLRLP